MDLDWDLKTIAVVLLLLGGLTYVFAPGAISDATDAVGELSIFGDGDDPDDEQKAVEQVAVSEYTVDGKIELPDTCGSCDAYLFADKPDTDAPVHWGDYVDFSSSDATSGLTKGVDYEKASVSSGSSITFSDLDAGTYHLVLVDTSSPRDYHYQFMQVEMPEKVAKFKVEQSEPIFLARKDQFDRFDTIDTDDTVSYNSDRSNTVALSADLDSDSSNITDRQRIVERTITLSGGKAYLGELIADNFNDGDGISKVDVTVTVDGDETFSKVLKDGSTDEFGSDNSYSKHLVDNPQENPEKSSKEVVITAEITYDYNTDGAGSDNGDIGDGESILDLKVEDLQDNTLGSAGTTNVKG